MGYSKEIYTAAAAALESRGKETRRKLQHNKSVAYAAVPALEDTERRLAAIGGRLMSEIGKGGDLQAAMKQLEAESREVRAQMDALLAQAGFPTDFLEPQPVCGLCGDTGYLRDGLCECHRQLLTKAAQEALRACAPAYDFAFGSFDVRLCGNEEDPASGVVPCNNMKKLLDYCRAYAEDFDLSSPSLFMHGKTGLGKTHLSLAIAMAAVEKGYGVVYGSVQTLLGKLEKERFDKSSADHGEAEESLLGCDLLVLDDLGTEVSTSFTLAWVYSIINTRLMRNLPTIISTNLTPEELEARYAERITSRITGCYVSLAFFGRDIRQIKSATE